MDALGRHCIIEYYGCPAEIVNDVAGIEAAMLQAARAMRVTIVASEFHRFNPFGVSGMVIIGQSHLSIHTWPELGYAAADIFTCSATIDPAVAHALLRVALRPTSESVIEIRRGILPGRPAAGEPAPP